MASKIQKNIILVGESADLFAFYGRLKRPEKVLGVFCRVGTDLPLGLERLGEVGDVPRFLDANVQIQRVYCSILQISLAGIKLVQGACKVRAVKFCLVMPVVNELDAKLHSIYVNGNVLLAPKNEPLTYLHNRVLKRVFDLVLVLLYMFFVFPFVYLWKSKFYNRKNRKPVFATDVCCGPNGKIFNRVSFLGDGSSLANVFNVLKGEMSLVGPACYELGQNGHISDLPKRLERRGVKSGMNGWAQIHKIPDEQRLEADIWYVEHWSLWLDVRILFASIF